jgi:hypothetical protein
MASAQAIAGPFARAETDEEKKLGNIMAKGSIADRLGKSLKKAYKP